LSKTIPRDTQNSKTKLFNTRTINKQIAPVSNTSSKKQEKINVDPKAAPILIKRSENNTKSATNNIKEKIKEETDKQRNNSLNNKTQTKQQESLQNSISGINYLRNSSVTTTKK